MKQQLKLDMEQQTSSKPGKEYVKAVYCHPAYLTYIQSASCKMQGWMKHKLESRSPGEIKNLRYVDDTSLMGDFPGGSDGKSSVYNEGDLASIPGLGKSPGEGNGNPLQYYCLENPMDRGAW